MYALLQRGLFYFMVVFKIEDEENSGQALEMYINKDNRIFINCGEIDKEEFSYQGFCTLSLDDAIQMRVELDRLISDLS